MAKKRKRPDRTTSNRPTKRQRPANHVQPRLPEPSPYLHHAVLSAFYPQVCSLRNYLLASLPATSRVRRRKLTLIGKDEAASILDTCLVGVLKQPSLSLKELRKADFATFTQTQHHATGANTARSQQVCIDEVGECQLDSDYWNATLIAHSRSLTSSSGPFSKPTQRSGAVRSMFSAMVFKEVQQMVVRDCRPRCLASSSDILTKI